MEISSALRQFYSTELAPCPYLPGRVERRVVTVLDPTNADESFDALTEAGFRRSQSYLYRPACPGCRACVSVRIVVDAFRPDRTGRKILQRNADLTVEEVPAVTTDEQYALFRRYLQARHDDGGMAQMTRQDYAEMVERGGRVAGLVELRRGDGTLVGVSLTDRLRSGLSGVYKFFDASEPKRSLGTFIILWHVQRARELGLPYVYLGYWVAGCRKMAYKVRFQPLEWLDGWTWRPMVPVAEG